MISLIAPYEETLVIAALIEGLQPSINNEQSNNLLDDKIRLLYLDRTHSQQQRRSTTVPFKFNTGVQDVCPIDRLAVHFASAPSSHRTIRSEQSVNMDFRKAQCRQAVDRMTASDYQSMWKVTYYSVPVSSLSQNESEFAFDCLISAASIAIESKLIRILSSICSMIFCLTVRPLDESTRIVTVSTLDQFRSQMLTFQRPQQLKERIVSSVWTCISENKPESETRTSTMCRCLLRSVD